MENLAWWISCLKKPKAKGEQRGVFGFLTPSNPFYRAVLKMIWGRNITKLKLDITSKAKLDTLYTNVHFCCSVAFIIFFSESVLSFSIDSSKKPNKSCSQICKWQCFFGENCYCKEDENDSMKKCVEIHIIKILQTKPHVISFMRWVIIQKRLYRFYAILFYIFLGIQ